MPSNRHLCIFSNLGLGDAATLNAITDKVTTTSNSSRLFTAGSVGLGNARHIDSFSDTTMLGFGRYTSSTLNSPGGNGVGLQLQYDGSLSTSWFVWTNDGGAYIQTNHIQGGQYLWKKVYTESNTTKASDGTLKAASPIVQIFHDGRSQLNEESEGCTVARLGVGEYLIEGCMGLNADAAWGGIDGGFDIPKDRNRQALVWLDYEVNADGSVLVKTYHRTYPDAPPFARNDIAGLANGEPVDIPADQFVSVRVEMPIDSIWNQKVATTELDIIEEGGSLSD